MSTIVLLAVIAGIVLWMVGTYNGLISLKNQVVNGWNQIMATFELHIDLLPSIDDLVLERDEPIVRADHPQDDPRDDGQQNNCAHVGSLLSGDRPGGLGPGLLRSRNSAQPRANRQWPYERGLLLPRSFIGRGVLRDSYRSFQPHYRRQHLS